MYIADDIYITYVIISRKKDRLSPCTRIANGGDYFLNGCSPGLDVHIVWFVHDTKPDLLLAGVLLGELGPQANKLVIGRATLSNNATVPAGTKSEL